MLLTVHGTLACFRPRCEPVPVRLAGLPWGSVLDLPAAALQPVQAAAALFAEEWPVAAGCMEAIEIVDSLTAEGAASSDVACSITDSRLGRVSSRVQMLLSLFLDPNADQRLHDWNASGDIVSSGRDGIVWHEFGHSLLNLLVLRVNPSARSAESAAKLIVTRALSAITTVDIALASTKLSRQAGRSCEEFIAEAMADFGVHGHRAHYISVAVASVLAELWKE